MSGFQTTIDQWLIFRTVVETGGFEHAAQKLNRSRSTLSYAISKLEDNLGVTLFEIEGRKAVLTAQGKALLDDASLVLESLSRVEQRALFLAKNSFGSLRVAIDSIFPRRCLYKALKTFRESNSQTRLQITELIWTELNKMYQNFEADLFVMNHIPDGAIGKKIFEVPMLLVASEEHPLSKLDHLLSQRDLAEHLRIRIETNPGQNPTGLRSGDPIGPFWSVANLDSALLSIESGLGYGWLPRHRVAPSLRSGKLKHLKTEQGNIRILPLYLIHAQAAVEPSAREFASILETISGSK